MSSADGAPVKRTEKETGDPVKAAAREGLPAEGAVVLEAAGPRATDQGGGGYRKAALSGAVWIGVGFGTMYVLRFVSGMILTRLVVPVDYGLLDIANVFIQGLHMFTDIGIGIGVIQSKRGEEPDFLNTAWTLQVIRGLALWLASGLIGWAVAAFYEQPVLLLVIPAIGVTAAIDSFNATTLFVLTRRLARGRLVMLEVVVQTTGIVVTIVWMVCVEPSVWGFVAGSLVTSMLNMTLTHVALPGGRTRFRWEATAARELFHFGKWVLVGTMITFLAYQAERLIVAKAGGPQLMGIYGRALALAGIATGLMSSFATQLILPLYSRMHQSGRDIRSSFGMVHGTATAFAAFLVTGLLAAGPAGVHCLYGDLYHEAGWMLQFVAIGTWFQMLEGTIDASLLTLGQTRAVTMGNGSRLLAVLIFVPGGYWLGQRAGLGGPLEGGFIGMLLGFLVADVLRYLLVVWLARQNGLSAVASDTVLSLLILAISLATLGAGKLLEPLVHGRVAHPKVQALVLFLGQGILVVFVWGLVYSLWFRKKLRGSFRGSEAAPLGAKPGMENAL